MTSKTKSVIVTSGVFEIPLDEDGTLSLKSLRAQLPGASGLWYLSEDNLKKIVKYDKVRHKLLPPDNEWTNMTYNVSYSALDKGVFIDEKEIQRYEKASATLYKSVETLFKITHSDSFERYKTASYKPNEHKVLSGEEKSASLEFSPLNTTSNEELRSRCLLLEEIILKKDKALSDAQENITTLRKELAEKTTFAQMIEKKHNEAEGASAKTSKELLNVKQNLEKTKKEFDYSSGPIEGFGDPHILKESPSLKKQLDDVRWRCGELEASLHTKNREAVALRDWKREAEQTINNLQTEHGVCNSRKEQLEATIHALHQFAMLMKRELEKRAGLEPAKISIISNNRAFEDAEERIRRFEKDLDLARDDLCRRVEEITDWKWKYTQLESQFVAMDKENKLIITESNRKEVQLRTQLDNLEKEIKAVRDTKSNGSVDIAQSEVQDDDDDDEVENTLDERTYEGNISESNNSDLNDD